MTTDKKQPPDTAQQIRKCASAWEGSVRLIGNVTASDVIALLDRYDEERKEWEAQIADLTEGMNSAIAHAVVERKELNAIRSQVTALTEERDDWKRAEHESLQYIDELVARADRAEKERDKWHAIYSETAEERDRAIAERDDLGCQLEALRAVQRGDVADLRMRMEAVEKMTARLALATAAGFNRDEFRDLNAIVEETHRDEKGGA